MVFFEEIFGLDTFLDDVFTDVGFFTALVVELARRADLRGPDFFFAEERFESKFSSAAFNSARSKSLSKRFLMELGALKLNFSREGDLDREL